MHNERVGGYEGRKRPQRVGGSRKGCSFIVDPPPKLQKVEGGGEGTKPEKASRIP